MDSTANCHVGRLEYFAALDEYWPELLNSLRRDVSPLYEPRFTIADDGSGVLVMDSWTRLQSDPERGQLLAAVKEWAERFRITEEWILNAALDTLSTYSVHRKGSADQWSWRYRPKGFHVRFAPKLEQDYWYPTVGWPEIWEAFRGRMEAQFRTQLGQYRRLVESNFCVGKEWVSRDAGWTARYQKGEIAIEIAEAENLIGYSDPEQAVFKAISKFAKLISLRLRRRGERIRFKTSVPPTP